MVRYSNNGAIDATFGNNGIVITDYNGLDNYTKSATVQSTGEILVLSNLDHANTSSSLCTRYLANGSIDASFGSNGYTENKLNQYTNNVNILINNSGKIIILTIDNDSTLYNKSNILQLNSNGTLDNNYAINGISKINNYPAPSVEGIFDFAVQSDGKIVAVGYTQNLKTSTLLF